MGVNFAKDWIAFVILGGFAAFVIFAVINSRKQERANKEEQAKNQKTPDNK